MIIKDFKTNTIITNMVTWKQTCSPKGNDNQWKPEYSAYELANEYLNFKCKSLTKIIGLHGSNFILDEAYPEKETRFDKYGQGRVHDLLLYGKNNGNRIVISVEGKVNESFGNETVSSYYMKNKIDIMNGLNTNKCKRIEEVLPKLFGKGIPKDIYDVKYQLITALIGTLHEACDANINEAYLIVQYFKTNQFDRRIHDTNHKELNKFVRCISGMKNLVLKEDQLVGPFKLGIYKDIEISIGYTITP